MALSLITFCSCSNSVQTKRARAVDIVETLITNLPFLDSLEYSEEMTCQFDKRREHHHRLIIGDGYGPKLKFLCILQSDCASASEHLQFLQNPDGCPNRVCLDYCRSLLVWGRVVGRGYFRVLVRYLVRLQCRRRTCFTYINISRDTSYKIMDALWHSEQYSPSAACEVAPYLQLPASKLEEEIQELQRLTKLIADLPYDPETWLTRAHVLRVLGFPELSLGDAYKAKLLVEAAVENSSILGSQVMTTFGMKIWLSYIDNPANSTWTYIITTSSELFDRVRDLLSQLEIQIWTEILEGLMSANCCTDYGRMAQKAVVKFPEDRIFPSEVANAESWTQQRVKILEEQGLQEEKMQATLDNGGILATAYPWMSDNMASRGADVLEVLKGEFKAASTCCVVGKSNVLDETTTDAGNEPAKGDVLGVVATKNIEAGSTILIDSTVAGVISNSDRCPTCCCNISQAGVRNLCCAVSYCSTACSELALATYHAAVCGKDFSFLVGPAELANDTTDFALDSMLLLRVIAMSVQDVLSHPLYSYLPCRLTPAYDTDQLIIFNFQDHIVTPIRMIEALGIDVFANLDYDTWVLHTLRCRIQNNKHGHYLDGFPGSAVSPLYSMFNHSCDPNVDWEHGNLPENDSATMGHSSTVRMFAERDIKQGEELFICYIKPRTMDWEQRQEALIGWWGGECGCTRCEREKAQADE